MLFVERIPFGSILGEFGPVMRHVAVVNVSIDPLIDEFQTIIGLCCASMLLPYIPLFYMCKTYSS